MVFSHCCKALRFHEFFDFLFPLPSLFEHGRSGPRSHVFGWLVGCLLFVVCLLFAVYCLLFLCVPTNTTIYTFYRTPKVKGQCYQMNRIQRLVQVRSMFRSFYRKKAWMAKAWNIYSICVIVGVSGPIIFNIPSRVPTEILQHSDTSSRLVPSLDVVHKGAAVRRDVEIVLVTVNSHRDSGHKSRNALMVLELPLHR